MKADYENGAEPERLHMIEKGSEGALYYFDPNRGADISSTSCACSVITLSSTISSTIVAPFLYILHRANI